MSKLANTTPNGTTARPAGPVWFALFAAATLSLAACSAEDGARRYCSSVDFIPGTEAYDDCVKAAIELKLDVENR